LPESARADHDALTNMTRVHIAITLDGEHRTHSTHDAIAVRARNGAMHVASLRP